MSIFDDMELVNRIALMPSGWQPIETAPKDGTEVLIFDGHDLTTALFEYGYWSVVVPGTYAEDSEVFPTHWMRLPASPGTISSEQA